MEEKDNIFSASVFSQIFLQNINFWIQFFLKTLDDSERNLSKLFF